MLRGRVLEMADDRVCDCVYEHVCMYRGCVYMCVSVSVCTSLHVCILSVLHHRQEGRSVM